MKAFLRNFFASVFGVLAALALLAVAALVLLLRQPEAGLPPGSILSVDLSIDISDRGLSPGAREIVLEGATESVELRQVRQALLAAAEDSRIGALYLHGDAAVGTATLETLREGLAACTAAGKPMFGYFDAPGEAELYLASAGGKIFVAPLSLVEFNGLALTSMFYRDLMDKAGLEMQVTRVGKYKSAVEPFLMSEMSEANREQLGRLAGDLSDVVMGGIATGRGLELDAVNELARTSGFLRPEQAVQAGLVNEVLPFDRILERLADAVDGDPADLRRIDLEDYLLRDDLPEIEDPVSPLGEAGTIAVVYAEGDIVDGEDDTDVGGDTVARKLRDLRLDDDVDAVVLRVNSPGGSAAASEVILREMQLLAEAKTVVVSMGDLAASGGYWISCQAHEIQIWARPGTITGSIGVFGMFPNAAGLLAEVGVSPQTVKTGEHADMNSFWRPKTEAELALFQVEVNGIYESFLDRVCAGRGLEREVVHEIAQGRVWSGTAALELGLVDQLGGLDEAIAAAAERAGLGSDYAVRWPWAPSDFLDQVLTNLENGEPPLGQAQALLERARELRQLVEANRFQARAPWIDVR